MEIRDQLTFELLTTLQPTETVNRPTGPLTYSPDGHSIACASDDSIVIWDIQTGGVAKEIRCGCKNVSMVWSLDGRTIGFIDSKKRVSTYDLVLGTITSPGEFSSTVDPYFWAHEKSFRILTTVSSDFSSLVKVEIFEVGHSLSKIRSFGFALSISEIGSLRISYSPTTCRFAISADCGLYILEDRDQIFLSREGEKISSHCFSSDGSVFAVATGTRIRVWKHVSGFYTQWEEFRCPGRTGRFLRFSPTQMSTLGCFGSVLRGWRLHDLPTFSKGDRHQYAGISRSGNYIATAYTSEKTITITDIDPQYPPRLIDTGTARDGFALTGNVLLALGREEVVAWLLTEGGLVNGVSSGKADITARIWAMKPSRSRHGPKFSVEGHVGVIAPGEGSSSYFTYHTETGEILRPDQARQSFSGPWKSFEDPPTDHDHSIHNLSQFNALPGGDWPTSKVALSEGWAKGPEGKRRLWVPIEWRESWDQCYDIATQFSILVLGGETVLIKF